MKIRSAHLIEGPGLFLTKIIPASGQEVGKEPQAKFERIHGVLCSVFTQQDERDPEIEVSEFKCIRSIDKDSASVVTTFIGTMSSKGFGIEIVVVGLFESRSQLAPYALTFATPRK